MCVLESERLILRPPRPCDIQSMTVWLSDYDVARMTSRVSHPYNEGDAEAFVAAGAANRFVIERKRDGLFLGMTGLHVDEDCIERGLRVSQEDQGFLGVLGGARLDSP